MPLRLLMLSPYRMPTHHVLMLSDDDMRAWENAWRLLWHPALLQQAEQLPNIADAADHATPVKDTLYSLPESPTPYLPENWDERVRQAGALVVRSTFDWSESLSRLTSAVAGVSAELPPHAAACFGLGYGYAVLDTLFEAMEHQKTLDMTVFAAEVKAVAAGDMTKAKVAAERLLAARESLYPAPIYLLDLAILGQGELPRNETSVNIIATAETLSALPTAQIDHLRKRVDDGSMELCGGIDHERPDACLPVESQLWNLQRGQRRIREMIGKPVSVYARTDTAFHPHIPNWLAQADISKLLYLSLDGSIIPHHAAATIRWPAPDGRHVDAVTRTPLPANEPQTGFHLAMHLHKTIMHDTSAAILLRHGKPMASLWYDDWLVLSKLAPVFGEWISVSHFLDESSIGEYASASTMDDYSPDLPSKIDPVSTFARHARNRRRLDAARTFLALVRTLGTPADMKLVPQIDHCENNIEEKLGEVSTDLIKTETLASEALATRLTARSTVKESGRLILNTCPFARRVALDLAQMTGIPATSSPVHAVQRDDDLTRLVVEVPELGYAWIPDGNAELQSPRMTLATETTVRNEHFEAEVDPETGGMRTFRAPHGRMDLLHQQLVWQPGSAMRADRVEITANGPALGEVTATGTLRDEHDQELGRFVQRYRAWLGRPMLELDIELQPAKPTSGFAWHDYFAARFIIRDENASIVRGVFGHASTTTHHRPGSPDFLEFHSGKNSVLVVTGGLPFAQRHGQNMIDVLLHTAGETSTSFQFQLGLNRPQPALAAQAAISPVAVVPLASKPPGGPSGWLMHLDTSHVLLTSLRPAKEPNAIIARFMEIAGIGGNVNLRFVREPRSAALVDPDGLLITDALVDGDTVSFDIIAHDLVNLRVEW